MAHWLKLLGSGTGEMDETLVPRVLRELRYPSRPRTSIDDRIALYALGADRVFAIVAVFGHPYEIAGPNHWDEWQVETRPALWMGYEGAPRLGDLIVARDLHQSIRQHTHIKLRPEEYQRAVDALRVAGAEEDSLYRP
jgi:hypothetical protein